MQPIFILSGTGISRKVTLIIKRKVRIFTTKISMLRKLTYLMRELRIILDEMDKLIDVREF